jgi:DNA-binding NtrC family response regulator/tetratricopeptide (TPR) repeat protein
VNGIDLGERYSYIRDLGSGGMGRVLQVLDRQLGTEVALKLLHGPPEDSAALEEFQREFALLARIDHPGIARAHDFGYLGGRPFFTSEFIPGEPLGSNGLSPPGPPLLECTRELAAALAFLHRSGILHLDVKPSNVIVTPREAGPRAVLIDFGLFRRGLPALPGRIVRGSLPYLAPEHFRGEPLGPWTDVYSLGVTLYRVAAGRFPRAHRLEQSREGAPRLDWDPAPPAPSRLGAALPEGLDHLILKCLALDPRSRFAGAAEFLEALEAIPGKPARAAAPAPASPVTIGREEELAAVDRFLRGVGRSEEGRSPPVLLLTGPPGLGQTHLLREVKLRAQTRGIAVALQTGYPGRKPSVGFLFSSASGLMPPIDPRPRSRWNAFLARLARPREAARSEVPEGERRMRWSGELARVFGELRSPFLLVADGLQFLDEVSVVLLVELVRYLLRSPPGERPPVGVAVGYREEGCLAGVLRELSAQLLAPGAAEVITLRPLDLAQTLRLHREARGETPRADGGLPLYQETGGYPARIVARTAGSEPAGAGRAPGHRERRLLLALSVLERPAPAGELGRLAGIASRAAGAMMRKLALEGLALEAAGPGGTHWLPGPAARDLAARAPAAARRALHLRAGLDLCRRAASSSDGRLAEAVRHFHRAGNRGRVVRHGLPAARSLKATYQYRAALDLLEAVLQVLPTRSLKLRIEAALTQAELRARVGEVDRGIRVLKDLLTGAMPSDGARARILLRLATLYSRRGDFRHADALFEEGFDASGGGPDRLRREEVIDFLNERAALKALLGEHGEALSLCDEGARLLGTVRNVRGREALLNLTATRAGVALRTFRYGDAISGYRTALRIAEAIGSPVNQAVVLNSLGIVYSNLDRYAEAVRAFGDAERMSLRLDEGPSLVSIYANLAILHAKTGDGTKAEQSLVEGERLLPGAMGPLQALVLQHARGLSLLQLGRPAAARPHLENAIRLGEETGDSLRKSFDEVYRAEALIFEGAYAEALRELERLSVPGRPPRPRAMARARRAFLVALLGRSAEVDRLLADRDAEPALPAVPFLDAWDDLYCGWALSISLGGEPGAWEGLVLRAREFFETRRLRPAAALAAWVATEGLFLRGEAARARDLLRPESFAANDLTRVLGPLLLARLLLVEGTSGGESERAADLLVEAGAALVGNPLPEWAARLELLRGRLGPGGAEAEAAAAAERRRLARGLPEELRRSYLSSPYWKSWTAGTPAARKWRRRHPAARPPLRLGAGSRSRTVSLRPREEEGSRAALVLKSPAMRRLACVLDRLRSSDLPVLIRGETGSGKEIVARVIHRESRRAPGPFLVVDCASIPAGLVEAELFGARAGAFTDLGKDRPGMLSLASGGTVLIEEIAGLGLELQAKLLRVLGRKTIRRLGDEVESPIDVRFLFTTVRDLEAEARAGRFREDLLHRMRVLTVEVPPLRERPEDIPDLAARFLGETTGPAVELGQGVLERLSRARWPGNARELRNLLARLRLECSGAITTADLDRASGESAAETVVPRTILERESLNTLRERLEREYLLHHLHRLRGNTRALARLLGLERQQLYRRARRLGIRFSEKKGK